MKNLLQKSFIILKENMLFIQPPLLFLFFVSLTIPYILNPNVIIYTKIIFAVCMILMSCATIAGTFYISKKAIDTYHQNDDMEVKKNNSIQNFKSFFEGVGKTFLKMFLSSFLFLIFSYIVLKALDITCTHFWGSPAFDSRMDEFLKIENAEQAKTFISSLSINEINNIRMWILSFLPVLYILNFLCLLYFAVVISEKDNFIKCFFKTIVFFLKNIIKSVSIIIVMFAFYIVINIITSLFGANSILLAIAIVFMVMYLNYYIILVLCFYNEKSESNSNSGPECIGENQSCD